MIKVSINLVPFGDESKTEQIVDISIWNDSENMYGFRANIRPWKSYPAATVFGAVEHDHEKNVAFLLRDVLDDITVALEK